MTTDHILKLKSLMFYTMYAKFEKNIFHRDKGQFGSVCSWLSLFGRVGQQDHLLHTQIVICPSSVVQFHLYILIFYSSMSSVDVTPRKKKCHA